MDSLVTQHPPPLTPSGIAFYATAATVIPILFLALAVEGSTWENMVRNVVTAGDVMRWRDPAARELRRASRLLFLLLAISGFLVIFAGFGGEFVAIATLYNGSNASGSAGFVVLAVILLTAGVAAVPAAKFGKVVLEAWLTAPASVEQIARPEEQADGTGEKDVPP